MIKSVRKFKQNMAKSHKSCMEQAEIIDTFGTYQLPSCNLFTSHGYFIVFWERDITSVHNRTPVHISNTVTPTTIYCFIYFSVSITIIIIPCILSFVNNKAGGTDNSSVLIGKQSYLLCVQVQVKLATSVVNGAIVHFTTYFFCWSPIGSTLN